MSELDKLIKGVLMGEVEVGVPELAILELSALRASHNELERELAYQVNIVLPRLRYELSKIKEKSANLLEKMNRAYGNTEYITAFTLYSTQMGDYKKNGGIQWTEEQDDLAALLTKG